MATRTGLMVCGSCCLYSIAILSQAWANGSSRATLGMLYLELTLLQENVPLNLLAQKYGLQYQTILNFQPPLPLNGNLRNTSYMKKIPNYEL